jgi:hypothetical protein
MKDRPNIPGWFYDYAEQLEHRLGRVIGAQDDEHYKNGMYPFIPLSPNEFISRIREAAIVYEALHPFLEEKWSESIVNFVDVGGGIGTKSMLGAAVLRDNLGRFVRAFNIEYNSTYCEISEKFLHPGRTINKDARLIRGGYKQFDIIYFYCPMANSKLQCELEKVIYDGSKEGSIHIQVMKMNSNFEEQPNLHSLKYGLFLKTSDLSLVEKAKAALSTQSVTTEP